MLSAASLGDDGALISSIRKDGNCGGAELGWAGMQGRLQVPLYSTVFVWQLGAGATECYMVTGLGRCN